MLDRTAEFKSRPPEWRIEAVIHDGSWYDVPKWARVAKVTQDDLNQWILKNKRKVHLIQSDEGESYRVSHDEVLKWYKMNPDISIKDKIIPKNYPPRLWDNRTEVEAFLEVPRRKTATLTFTIENNELLKKVIVSLAGIARVRYDKSGKYRAYGLSDEYMRQVLLKNLTKSEFDSLEIKRRKGMLHRELTDFSSKFIEEALTFYLPFSRNILKRHMSTLKIYLPDEKDIDSQIIAWVVSAMRKFDETKPIPFSGYLSTVLRFWPYDLPDEFLGKELSNFQRQRTKAIQSLTQEKSSASVFSNQEIADEMGIDIKDFVRLNNEHSTWLAERSATTLNWSDSSNEKSGQLIGYSSATEQNIKLAHNISVATINATLKTSRFDDGCAILTSIDRNVEDNDYKLSHLSDQFKRAFAYELNKSGTMSNKGIEHG